MSSSGPKRPQRTFAERRADFKAKPTDGIWLDRRGNENNWELFRTQFVDQAFAVHGEIASELGAAEDLDEEVVEPDEDPDSFEMEMKRLELVLKNKHS